MTILHPFVDYLKFTIPMGEAPFFRDEIEPLLTESGAHESLPGLFHLGDGTVKFREHGKVLTVGVSGAALTALRASGLFLPFLAVLGGYPHRVTQVDVAVDIATPAGPVVRKAYRDAISGKLQFSRKRIAPRHVKRISRVGHADGLETGTAYLGSRTAGICARIYDKRNEVLDNAVKLHGAHPDVIRLNDPGPLVRYEMTFGRKVGMTLRDVADPAALFWTFASCLLKPPKGVPSWEPHAEGYSLPPRPAPDPVRQLRLLLESSPDIQRALRLVHTLGGPEPSEGLNRLRGILLHRRLAA